MVDNMIAFLAETWRVWVSFAAASLAVYTLWYYLTQQRYYRAVNGKAQIKHGRLGHWEDLEEHLKSHE